MKALALKAEKRKVTGRKVKAIRRKGILPANIYGRKVASLSIQIESDKFQNVFKEAGETGLVEIDVDGDKRPVLIHNVQVDPVSDIPLHVDFLQVDLKQKVSAKVPVELVGESPAEKQGLGTVVQYFDEVEVEALPTDLPDKFEIDLTKLVEVDQSVQVKDLVLGSDKVELKTDVEQILVKVEPPRKVEEEAPVVTEDVAEEGATTESTGTAEGDSEESAGKAEESEG